jgi:hypothetical protein
MKPLWFFRKVLSTQLNRSRTKYYKFKFREYDESFIINNIPIII